MNAHLYLWTEKTGFWILSANNEDDFFKFFKRISSSVKPLAYAGDFIFFTSSSSRERIFLYSFTSNFLETGNFYGFKIDRPWHLSWQS